MKDLTPKQEAFVQGIFSGKSQRDAYKAAFNCENMTDKSVDECACRLAKKPEIKARLRELQDMVTVKSIATIENIITELSHIAFDDISNYLDYKQDADGNIKIRLKDSKKIDTRGVAEVSLTKDGTFKFKLHSKDNALIKLGQHLGMFVERSMNLNLNAEESTRLSQALSSSPELAAKAVELFRLSREVKGIN